MGSFSSSSTSHVPREEPVAEVLVFYVLCLNEAKILPCMGGDHGSEGAESVSSDQQISGRTVPPSANTQKRDD